MPSLWALLVAAIGIAAVSALALRDHGRRRTTHRGILDAVTGQFTGAELSRDATGLPRLEGNYHGQRHLRIDLIPDTMTIRRLPQLWLSITAIEKLPIADAGFATLVRPSGNDYYSLTEKMGEPLPIPASFPEECWVRGESDASVSTLAKAESAAAKIFKDPKVKEVAATARGARLVYQLAQGERGNYLLLRQCEFGDAKLDPALLSSLTEALSTVIDALKPASPSTSGPQTNA